MHIIAGKFKKKRLHAPKNEKVRPTTSQLRESLFNICQNKIEHAHFLDIFAGSGAMGLEALSRGADHATFVEANRLALKSIKKNISELGVGSLTTLYGLDVFKALALISESGKKFDLIYIDPPYGQGLGAKVLCYLDKNMLLNPEGVLFLEENLFEIPDLTHLKLKGTRRVGIAHLYEFNP